MATNIIITGVGGQGILTLTKVLANAALLAGYDVKSAETHGLAQRFGHIEVHLRFGDRIYSPLIQERDAHFIIALEMLEGARCAPYASPKTLTLIDEYMLTPTSVKMGARYPTKKEIEKLLGCKIIWTRAAKTVEEKTGNILGANIFMLGAVSKYLPIKERYLINSIKEIIKPKFVKLNLDLYKLGRRF